MLKGAARKLTRKCRFKKETSLLKLGQFIKMEICFNDIQKTNADVPRVLLMQPCICSGSCVGGVWVCRPCHRPFRSVIQGRINRPLMKLLNHWPVKTAEIEGQSGLIGDLLKPVEGGS